MQNKYQRLAGNTVKLGLGTFGSKVLVFLMVRFYTEYLSPPTMVQRTSSRRRRIC